MLGLFIKYVYLFKINFFLKTSLKQYVFNDPIYGFIRINDPLILLLIETPYFQRLRRIAQVGLSSLVYPGAHHTRFHHALGCLHLMQQAIYVLKSKGISINENEERALQVAILLHDIGHGPFSHAMEKSIIGGMSHETLSLKFMEILNEQFEGQLDMAIEIFKGESKRFFFNQLVSSQLDMDRLDYLKRDSFYTGVAEGNINSERLISMLHVIDNTLVIEEKGLYSVEKFLMARRFMYWQVYLHKTGIVAEAILIKIFERAKELIKQGNIFKASEALLYFLSHEIDSKNIDKSMMERFSKLDDIDIYAAIKNGCDHEDFILSKLCHMIIDRRLPHIKIKNQPISTDKLAQKTNHLLIKNSISETDVHYFVFEGTLNNIAYTADKHPIYLLKNGFKKIDIAKNLTPAFLLALSEKVEKYYICYPKKGF
jgi:HD superfamily phosphohydrolase